eukprot:Platyproteum_vivax@DN5781_c1_g1_i2.p1
MKKNDRKLGEDNSFGGTVKDLTKLFDKQQYEMTDNRIRVVWTVKLNQNGKHFLHENDQNTDTKVTELIKTVVKKEFLGIKGHKKGSGCLRGPFCKRCRKSEKTPKIKYEVTGTVRTVVYISAPSGF